MSSEPGGVAVGGVEVAGSDASSGLYLYPPAIVGLATLFGPFFFIGSLGVSDIFYVGSDVGTFIVSPDATTFIVPPGRTQ